MNESVIGIDLGTTHSEVAIIHDGKPQVLAIDGSPLVPSVVSLGPDGALLVGQAALNNELNAPADTVRWIKRRMGTDAVVRLGGRDWTPPEVSAAILRYLKAAAERHLGRTVARAVVTVPAFFSERAREDTRTAARLAGLDLLRLVNEPTAAAMAYAMGGRQPGRWLVYDLGGGTFDVSVVDCAADLMEVRASHGDVQLGGHDFDRLLAERAAEDFRKRHGIDVRADARAWARVLRAAEAAKIRLSTEPETVLREEYLAGGQHLAFAVRRTELETLLRPALDRTLASVRTALELAGSRADALARVLLVGGATRMPLVAHLLRAELGIEPQAWINPDTVVAQGAAVEAAASVGTPIGRMLVDISPHSLGVGAIGHDYTYHVVPLIHRNTPLPATATEMFHKHSDDQDRIDIEVFQGESPDPERCQRIGAFTLDGLGHSPTREVHCRFDLDRSGLLRVAITDLGSGKRHERVIERQGGVRQADLARLDSVRLTDAVAIGDDDEAWATHTPDDHADAPAAAAATAPETPASDGDGALFAQAEALLARSDLDATDREDLAGRLADARGGDAAARTRLADLVYFLQ